MNDHQMSKVNTDTATTVVKPGDTWLNEQTLGDKLDASNGISQAAVAVSKRRDKWRSDSVTDGLVAVIDLSDTERFGDMNWSIIVEGVKQWRRLLIGEYDFKDVESFKLIVIIEYAKKSEKFKRATLLINHLTTELRYFHMPSMQVIYSCDLPCHIIATYDIYIRLNIT